MSGGSTRADPPVRVLLADDHDLVRAGFRVILGAEHDIEVVAEAGDGSALRRWLPPRTARQH